MVYNLHYITQKFAREFKYFKKNYKFSCVILFHNTLMQCQYFLTLLCNLIGPILSYLYCDQPKLYKHTIIISKYLQNMCQKVISIILHLNTHFSYQILMQINMVSSLDMPIAFVHNNICHHQGKPIHPQFPLGVR